MISIFNFLLKRCQLLQNLGEIKLDSYFDSVSLKLKIIKNPRYCLFGHIELLTWWFNTHFLG